MSDFHPFILANWNYPYEEHIHGYQIGLYIMFWSLVQKPHQLFTCQQLDPLNEKKITHFLASLFYINAITVKSPEGQVNFIMIIFDFSTVISFLRIPNPSKID